MEVVPLKLQKIGARKIIWFSGGFKNCSKYPGFDRCDIEIFRLSGKLDSAFCSCRISEFSVGVLPSLAPPPPDGKRKDEAAFVVLYYF